LPVVNVSNRPNVYVGFGPLKFGLGHDPLSSSLKPTFLHTSKLLPLFFKSCNKPQNSKFAKGLKIPAPKNKNHQLLHW
ncbi:hypothetical protein, partial [Desulfofundulus salinus]|uniref:hypothetical protein n=1 Tax=Desulfofundulus salinus TaxID=2419843 RepID=UPI001A9B198F